MPDYSSVLWDNFHCATALVAVAPFAVKAFRLCALRVLCGKSLSATPEALTYYYQ